MEDLIYNSLVEHFPGEVSGNEKSHQTSRKMPMIIDAYSRGQEICRKKWLKPEVLTIYYFLRNLWVLPTLDGIIAFIFLFHFPGLTQILLISRFKPEIMQTRGRFSTFLTSDPVWPESDRKNRNMPFLQVGVT